MASFSASVGRNTAIQFFGKIVSTIIGFITTAIMLRYLQPSGFGSYTAAIAYAGFFSVIADLGLYLILIRDFNKPNADREKILGNALGIRWASAICILGGSAIVAFALPFYSPEVKRAIVVAALSFVAVAGTQLMTAVFQTHLVTWWISLGEILGRLMLLIGVWWVMSIHGGLLMMMAAVMLGSLINFIFVSVVANRYIRVRIRFDFPVWRQMIIDTLPISISIVLNLLYFKADTIFLSVFQKGDAAIGLYGAAYKVLEILITFPLMFVGLLLPSLGRTFAAQEKEKFVRLFQRGFEVLLILVVPIMVGGSIIAREILVAIGKESYAPAAGVLQLLLIAVGATFLNALSGHTVTIINKQRQMIFGYLTVAVVGLATYLLLIPRFSYYGAAIGTIITEVLSAIIGYVMILRTVQFRLQAGIIWKLLISGGLMAVSMFALLPIQPWLALGAGTLAYCLSILMTRAIPLSMVQEVFQRSQTVEALPPTP